ncbi:MAG TPA: potassium-transporting ATPase subunit KdpC [Acidobacteriota bacterium]|nr:potassium-transporting ATPase subunit KdpC [Acidobacteriota bacterium]
MKGWLADLRSSVLAVAILGLIVGGVYPLAAWVLAQTIFPGRANGSLVERDGRVIGSSLIGQPFRSPAYFHPRPSAAGEGYDAARSGGANLGPLSKALAEAVRARAAAYRAENGLAPGAAVPADAVTASASGLDPHISPENARIQAQRVARARGLSEAEVLSRVEASTEGRTLGVLGEPRVNVLLLNLSLDGVRDAGK